MSAETEKEKAGFVIGYDLNDRMSQISYYELNRNVPETLISDSEEERLGIPTVLCKRKDVSQWYYGKEAERVVAHGEGTLVGKLLSFARAGAKIELEGEAYDSVELLILFVRRTLNLLSALTSPDQVEAMIFTVDTLEGRTIEVLERIAYAIPVDREKIAFQTYEESSYYYILHQPKELWQNEVFIFDYSDQCMRSYGLWMNRRTVPVVSFVDRTDFTEIRMPQLMMEGEPSREKEERLDEYVLRTMHEMFSGKTVGTVFLLGEGFEEAWCDKTLKYLCMGKRVFQGKNLYSKGACYCAKDRIIPCELNKNYVFLGKDKLKFNLGVQMRHMGKEEYLALADAGENWYDAAAQIDFLLNGKNVVPLVITPLDGKEPQEVLIELAGLPERPPKASRLQLKVSFQSETKIFARIYDLGFGELYPASGRIWDKEVELV
ncbi:MAG: DUF5716 family protein [Lachnospiraceae bacterium]